MPTVLFFRPNKDFAMQYASYWLGLGVEEAAKRGYSVVDLVDEATTFETLQQIMTTEKVDVAIMGGHGAPSIFTGFEQQIVLEACRNDEVMSGTISHFLSCSVGQMLLPSIIEKKGIWTVGYQVDFQFIVNTAFTIPDDPYAEPFKDVTLAIVRKILDGGTLKEAWDMGIAKCNEWIAKLWERVGTDWAEVIACLEHNRDGMIGLGDKEAYVLPPRRIAITAQGIVVLGLIGYLLTRR